jgi:hypothetical protein
MMRAMSAHVIVRVCLRACVHALLLTYRPRRARDSDARGPAGSSARAEPIRGGAGQLRNPRCRPPSPRRAWRGERECVDWRTSSGVQDTGRGALCHSGSVGTRSAAHAGARARSRRGK